MKKVLKPDFRGLFIEAPVWNWAKKTQIEAFCKNEDLIKRNTAPPQKFLMMTQGDLFGVKMGGGDISPQGCGKPNQKYMVPFGKCGRPLLMIQGYA